MASPFGRGNKSGTAERFQKPLSLAFEQNSSAKDKGFFILILR